MDLLSLEMGPRKVTEGCPFIESSACQNLHSRAGPGGESSKWEVSMETENNVEGRQSPAEE